MDVRRKRCGKCRRNRLTTFFGPHKSSADRLTYDCRQCRAERGRKERRISGATPARKYRDGGGRKECRKCGKRRLLKFFSPARRGAFGVSAFCKECNARYRRSVKSAAYVRKWRRGNVRWALHHRLHQRARKANVSDGDLTVEQAANVLSSPRCFYCKRFIKKKHRTIEHKVPLSRGGKHTASNVVMACGRCNSRKSSMTSEEFIEREIGG